MNSYRRRGTGLRVTTFLSVFAFLVAGAAGATGTWSSQPEPATAPADRAAPPEVVAALNQAIRAYSDRDFEQARTILTELRRTQPDNVAVQYYLGLIYLEDGLRASGERDRAGARRAFLDARQALSNVITLVEDQGLRPIAEAYLDVGIATLGGDDPDRELQRQSLESARRAADSLERYVASEGRDDPLGHFYLGVANYKIAYIGKQTDKLRASDRAFARATELAATHPEFSDADKRQRFIHKASYYRALLLVRSDPQAARHALERVVTSAPEANVEIANNAQQIIDKIDEQQRLSPGPMTLAEGVYADGFVNIGNHYDTNVILLGQDTILPRGISQKYDYKFGLEAGLDVRKEFTAAKDPILGQSFSLGIGGSTFNNWQPSIEEFDINTYEGHAYINWEPVRDIFLGLVYSYSYTKLGYDPYISSNRITPVLSKVWRKGSGEEAGRTDLFYSFDYRNYLDDISDPRFDRDGKYHLVGVTQSFNICRAADLWKDYYAAEEGRLPRDGRDAFRWLSPEIGYYYRNERTQGDEFDLSGNTIFAKIDVPLPWRLTFDFQGHFTWDDYSQPSLLDYRRNERYDFIQRYVFGLTRTIIDNGEDKTLKTLRVRARAGVELTFQDSNIWDRLSQDIYSFDRAIYTIQLLVDF